MSFAPKTKVKYRPDKEGINLKSRLRTGVVVSRRGGYAMVLWQGLKVARMVADEDLISCSLHPLQKEPPHYDGC